MDQIFSSRIFEPFTPFACPVIASAHSLCANAHRTLATAPCTRHIRAIVAVRASLGLLALLALTACAPEPPRTPDVQDPMAQGLALLQAGDGPAAADRFRAVLAGNPSHYGAQYQLGVALDLAGEAGAALPEWEKALALALQYGDSSSATTIRTRLARGDSLTDEQLMARAIRKLYTLNDPQSAAVDLETIVTRTPSHYGAHFQMATAYDRAGRPEKATPVWEQFLQMAVNIGDEENAVIARARLAATPR